MIRINMDDLERTLQEIVEKLDAIEKSLSQPPTKERTPGESETLRVIEKSDGTVALQLKSSNGWVESDNSEASGFKTVDQ